ncbi:Pimeloyl-[acyl-carrier protein] methyl ester esterase [Buchnera aphidicola (Eriosoma grossulariae)]|uniref:pimeloyl-ACP methyl ester esterase BioH n=1 Tax=Buchnera aphidicola TaxID=9 RepID=UPI0034644CC6
MKKLIFNIIGNGKPNLVLLHGYGFNSKIWNIIINNLKPYFNLYLIDLPGFGNNNQYYMNLEETVNTLSQNIPEKSIWMGWSLGGLVASKLSLMYPNNVIAIITVSSSPYFIQEKSWPGISRIQLKNFYYKTKNNFLDTIEKFLLLQSGDIANQNQIRYLIKLILLEKKPNSLALKIGFNILNKIDLRKKIKKSSIPLLRIYGKLDTIVPYEIKNILDQYWPNTYSSILNKSAHIPFISQSHLFCQIILKFLYFLKKYKKMN